MIQTGQVCKDCAPGRCRDCPSTLEPLEIACSRCSSRGCPDCGGTGWIVIDSCPQRWIGRDTIELVECMSLFRRGLPPVAGGVLDQTHWFVSAASFYQNEYERERARSDPFASLSEHA